MFRKRICTTFERMETKGKQERTVVHLQLGDAHEYYGNLKAMFGRHGQEELGVSYNYLKNFGLSPEHPYVGKRCIVRRGIIVTSPRGGAGLEKE